MVIVLLKGRLPDGGSVHLDNVGAMVLVSEVEDIIVIARVESVRTTQLRLQPYGLKSSRRVGGVE